MLVPRGASNAVEFMKRACRLAVLVPAVLLLVLPGLASAEIFYVSTTGDDIMGFGTFDNPWKTITKAAAAVPAGTAGAPNVIMVEAGTYNITNGEIFPITFAKDYVSLTGAGSGTTFIEPAAISYDSLHIDATGISVSGFTFLNNSDADAIVITEGGFNIHDNVFETMVRDGITFYLSETDRATDISFADMAITNNTFKTTQNGVYVYVEIDFDDTVTGLTAAFGNFDISSNTFPLTSGDGIYISNLFDVSDITDGTVTIGNFTATGNTFTGGDTGIYFYGSVYYMDDTQVTVANVTVSNNTCTNQSRYGIYMDYWDMGYFYGTTNAVFGDLTVSGNTVQATYALYTSAHGIYISDIDYIEYLYDETTVTTGNINVNNNTVDVHNYGIYLYSEGIYYIGTDGGGDSVSVTTGSRTITGNTLNSDQYYGLYLDLEYIGYEMYGTSTVNYGSFNISGNTVTSEYESLYVYWYEAGYDLDDSSSVTLGSVTVNNNTLASANAEALYYEFYECGNYDMVMNSAVQFGPTGITNNTMTAGGDAGIEFYFEEVAYEMYDNASFIMGPVTIDNNTIDATDGYGISITYYDYLVGSYMENNATATLPDWIITDNTIDVTSSVEYYGLYFYTYSNPDDNTDSSSVKYGSMFIDNNTFNPDKDAGMDYGIYLFLDDVVEGGYVSAKASFGDITITNNTLYAIENEAVYVYYGEVGYDFSGMPTLTMGDIEIGNNTIDTAPTGIDLYFDELYSADHAKVTIGGLDIHDNTLTNIGEYGIYVYYYNYNENPATTTLTIGAPEISGNTVSGKPASNTGIHLYVDNSTAGITLGMPVLTGNTVSGFGYGVYLDGVPEASLSCNFIENNNLIGMAFDTNGTNFEVHTNSLVNNNVGLAVYKSGTAVVNAERNWWGDKAGPAACASCNGVDPGTSGTIDYEPWLIFQPDKARCGQPFPWLMFVPAITGMGK